MMSMSCHLRKMAEWFAPILWSLGDASANSQDVHHDEINIAEIPTRRRRQSSGALVETVTIVCGGQLRGSPPVVTNCNALVDDFRAAESQSAPRRG